MEEIKTAFVMIYCDLTPSLFSEDMLSNLATGDEIHDFLLEDAGLCIGKDGKPIPGDARIWYLGLTYSWGMLRFEKLNFGWGRGGASFDLVEAFAITLLKYRTVTKEQFLRIKKKIDEGRGLPNLAHLRHYLVHRCNQTASSQKYSA